MKNILIVSDNEFLNLLYGINLEVYLALDAMIVRSVVGAIEILKFNKFDLILTLEVINNKASSKLLDDYLKSHGKKIPIIITDTTKDGVISENIFGVTAKFNIQGILKLSAKILGITAKQMAELDVGAYYPISLTLLLSFSKAPCRIYIQNNDEKSYTPLVRSDDPLGDLLLDLSKEGILHVFVNSKDRLVITNKISLALIEKITESLNNIEGALVTKKVHVLSDGYEFAAANLFSSDEIKQQMQEIATAASKVMQDVASEVSNIKALLAIMIGNRDGYIFTHSMIISYVTYHMIKNVTWGGEGQVEKINFVLFFHDIFLAPIFLKHQELRIESNLLDNDKLDEKEKDIILNHAKLAAELVVGYKRCPMGADILIKHHHGMKKGKGFVKFYMEDLSPLSKVFLVAEMFVEEFMKAHEEQTPFDTKLIIPKLISQFTSPSFTRVIQSLVHVPL